MSKPNILAIIGSLRASSFNRQLALQAQEACGAHVNFKILEYTDVPMMNEDIEFPAPEAVLRVRGMVSAADGIWFFLPEYNHFFPGVLKNLLDWLSRPPEPNEKQVLFNKAAAISGISLGMSGTAVAQDHLVTLLSLLNMRIMNVPRLTIPNAMQQLEGGKLVLRASKPFMEEQARAFVEFIAASKVV